MGSNSNTGLPKENLEIDLTNNNSMANFLPGLDQYRLQLYHYAIAERMRLAHQLHPQHSITQSPSTHYGISSNYAAPVPLYPSGVSYPRNLALSMALFHPQQVIPEEPKPQHSYIGLIAMAILSSPEKKLVLSDIYQHILENYPYFRRRGPGWRNSIRHNLSLNDCFVKSGRSANGKGHYWAIHPANLEDFRRGDFRRRKAQRKVRRHMGLVVDEEPDSPSPPPLPTSPLPINIHGAPLAPHPLTSIWNSQQHQPQPINRISNTQNSSPQVNIQTHHQITLQPSRKRQFDVASLLAPDDLRAETDFQLSHSHRLSCSEDEQEQDDEDVNVDAVTEQNQPILSSIIKPTNHISWKDSTCGTIPNQQIISNHLNNHLCFENFHMSTDLNSESSI